jgi:hypothetical protein
LHNDQERSYKHGALEVHKTVKGNTNEWRCSKDGGNDKISRSVGQSGFHIEICQGTVQGCIIRHQDDTINVFFSTLERHTANILHHHAPLPTLTGKLASKSGSVKSVTTTTLLRPRPYRQHHMKLYSDATGQARRGRRLARDRFRLHLHPLAKRPHL